ncbi:MAG TPA: bifunctional diaminohydroxyphosphoribosylaminopyrimidine deaminase/5-amino-6-(5-phosphoribosylamino)uracil reductase RibD [Methylomirabilota bacterium]|nr:bifunctional diaminohydroxyphosphoribosylaminopyrimidine deaminase/5-amino-6-(5-phosphoribosylamino)uracil reductase RibD [Methylomirabilota bacterium]
MRTPRSKASLARSRPSEAGTDAPFLRLALRLARRGFGTTAPNPMVGAVLVKRGQIIGQGWHRRAGGPHAEIEALRDCERRGHSPRGATLYVTLEPCCTHGRTPPCTDAIVAAGIRRVVAAAIDPNPRHAGRGFRLLRRAGTIVNVPGAAWAAEVARLNEAFNHWIVHRTPFVTVKAAMTLDGKIATASGESKWITGEAARRLGMKLRQGADAILVGVNTILADDPSLTVRLGAAKSGSARADLASCAPRLRRIVLDAQARTPVRAKVVADEWAHLSTIVVGRNAPASRVRALSRRVRVWRAPVRDGRIDLRWLLRRLGREEVTHLLVEGGGEVNASFLLGGLAQRTAFFYAPKVLGGRDARKAVAGEGVGSLKRALPLRELEWRRVGPDLFVTARVG